VKHYAQHGFGDGQKTADGLDQGLIDGVIFSPKDIGLDKLHARLAQIASDHGHADRLFDPQYYACFVANHPDSRLGNLVDDYGAHYFEARRRSQLESEVNVRAVLEKAIGFQKSIDLSAVIAPNILVSASCNSVEAVISKHFLRQTRSVARSLGIDKPVYATLAISRDALVNRAEFLEFLEDITALDDPPDGFYLLVAANHSDARAEIFHADVIAGWMLLNFTLTVNGFQVINGYSDTLSPFLGIAGGHAGASGWWSNLRAFGLEKFGPQALGGRLPVVRYLSCALINRVTSFELDAVRVAVPQVLNGLPTDDYYRINTEPERNKEVLQSWDAVKALNQQIIAGDVAIGLSNAKRALLAARNINQILEANLPFSLDAKSDGSHLEPLNEGLALFETLAELR
jgi:hypothetical protein